MRIVGTKYCGHDSALCILDTDKKTIFAISTERVTRIKHDSLDITPILDKYLFHSVDYVSHSYNFILLPSKVFYTILSIAGKFI